MRHYPYLKYEDLCLSRDELARQIAETVAAGGEPDPWDIDGFRGVCVEIERRDTALMDWVDEFLRQADRTGGWRECVMDRDFANKDALEEAVDTYARMLADALADGSVPMKRQISEYRRLRDKCRRALEEEQ